MEAGTGVSPPWSLESAGGENACASLALVIARAEDEACNSRL